jgi:hypothetical protein
MEKRTAILSTTAFDAAKLTACTHELIRKELTLSEFNVIDNNHISIDGTSIEVTDHAFRRLLARLRIPQAFAKRFSTGFGDDGLRQLVQMMKTVKSSHNDQSVTLLVNPQTLSIIDILPSNYASISNNSFFDFASRYIDQYNLGVTAVGSNETGHSQINTVSDSGIYSVPGMKNEIFQTGITFTNSPLRGLEVSPYLNRLICTNGISSTAFSENYSLRSLTDKSIAEFNDHMILMAGNGFQPAGLTETIKRANNTQASLAELQKGVNALLSSDKRVDFEYVQRYIPLTRSLQAYESLGCDPSDFTGNQLKNAKSGVTVYNLVNAMTNFASNDTRYSLDSLKSANLMITAGNILTKTAYDTSAVVGVDPFYKDLLLTERETAFTIGNN